jgi:hypothetical protein
MRKCGGELEELHWRLNEAGIDHAAGLLSTLSKIAHRLGLNPPRDGLDFQVYVGQIDAVHEILGGIIVEPALVPNLASRAVLMCGVPHASLEDLVVSVVLNADKQWYIDTVRRIIELLGSSLNWEWIMETLHRFKQASIFKRLIPIERQWMK